MDLNDSQKKLLDDFKDIEQIKREMKDSKIFAFSVLHALYRDNISIEAKEEILRTIVMDDVTDFFKDGRLTHEILFLVKSDRKRGLKFIYDLIKLKGLKDIDDHHLCKEDESLNPLSIEEIKYLFEAFELSKRNTFLIESKFFFSKACTLNFLNLLNCIKEWIGNPKYHFFILAFCQDLVKIFHDRKINDGKLKREFSQIIEDDLKQKNIIVKKTIADFKSGTDIRKFSDYINYLLSLYNISEYNKEKISENLESHKILKEFLPKLEKFVEEEFFEHPLLFFLNDEKSTNEIKNKINLLLDAQLNAEIYSYSTIELWDLEDSLEKIQKSGLTKHIRDSLTNSRDHHELHDFISELTVYKMLSEIGEYKPYPSNQLDGRLKLKDQIVNIEIAHPKSDKCIEYGTGGSLHAHGKASILKDKLDQLERKKDFEKSKETPYLVIINKSHSFLRSCDLKNYLYGSLSWRTTIEKKTGRVISDELLFDPKKRGLPYEMSKYLSAVLLYKRAITPFGIQYSADWIPNDTINPIPNVLKEEILRKFNRFVICPKIK